MAVSRSEESQALGETHNLIARGALRTSFHLRRYMPLYAFGTVWVVMLALLPTIDHHSSNGTLATAGGGAQTPAASGAAPTDNGTSGLPAAGSSQVASGAAGNSSSVGGGGGSAAAAGAPTASAAAAAGPPAAVQAGTGMTKAGVPCSKGVRQIPGSLYAAPCVAKYSAGNNGATYNGVTADTIKIAIRIPLDSQGPNAQAVDQVNAAGGQLTNSQQNQMVHDLVPYFNKMFELYGRHVQLVDFNGKGNGTLEAQSKGQEAACADANAIASSVHAFGVIRYGGFLLESQPFAECALQYKLYVPQGAPYFPEQYYQRWNPYVWATTMDCERIAHDVAEYTGKRLLGKKAKWAGDPLLQNSVRKFATYVPDNPGYGRCVNITQSDFKNKYGGDPGDRYNYALDVSQFPSLAARGAVQFNANHDTTVILACDYISMVLLTQAAAQQHYHPEWLLIGVALTDTDGFARITDQSETAGHLFGLSQAGDDKVANDPNGEAALGYKAATGKAMPRGGAPVYFQLLSMFDQLQAAGPVLTPANIATGTHAMPPAGGDKAAVGTWDFSNDHTGINDSREIYWDPNATAYDGKKGDYLATYGGKRFSTGQWPREDPPIYPGH